MFLPCASFNFHDVVEAHTVDSQGCADLVKSMAGMNNSLASESFAEVENVRSKIQKK